MVSRPFVSLIILHVSRAIRCVTHATSLSYTGHGDGPCDALLRGSLSVSSYRRNRSTSFVRMARKRVKREPTEPSRRSGRLLNVKPEHDGSAVDALRDDEDAPPLHERLERALLPDLAPTLRPVIFG